MFCNRRLCCSRNVLPSKINLDERRVAKCYELMNFWGNPIKKKDLLKSISGATCVGMVIATNLLSAENVTKKQLEMFIAEQVESNIVILFTDLEK